MASYMLAQLQLKYGIANLNRYKEAMVTVQKFFENEGIRLRHGMITRVGRLYEVWNLWEIEDHGHVSRALARGANQPEASAVNTALAEVVEYENVRFLDTLPFSLESQKQGDAHTEQSPPIP